MKNFTVKAASVLLILLITLTTVHADGYYDKFEYRTYTDAQTGTSLPYRLYLPPSYSADNDYPLVIFLHGAGSRGTDNELQFLGSCLPYMLNFGYTEAIMFAPQCPEDSQWVLTPWEDGAYSTDNVDISPQLDTTIELIGELCRTYSVDLSRIYLTGLSMGGFGTWDLITRYPDIFAAAMPICGSGDPSKGEVLAKSPTAIWTFHGTSDPVVPFEGTKSTVDAILNAGGTVEFTEYKGMTHDTWTTTYSNPTVYEWMFAQKLENTDAARLLFDIKEDSHSPSQESETDIKPSEPSEPSILIKPLNAILPPTLIICAVLLIFTAVKYIIKRK